MVHPLPTIIMLGAVAFMVACVGWITRDRDHSRQRASLRRKYLALSPLGVGPAEIAMRKALQGMKNRHPDRSGSWHLRRLIAELRRDAR